MMGKCRVCCCCSVAFYVETHRISGYRKSRISGQICSHVFFIYRGQQLSDNGKRQCAVVTVGTVLFITKNKNDFVKGGKMYSILTIFVDKNKLL